MMNPSRLDRAAAELRSASFDVLSHLAVLRAYRAATEIRYRVDQLRAPKGQPDGGQWVRDAVHVAVVKPRAPRCQGALCQNGGSFGTSGTIRIDGKMRCWDCTIKYLGIQGLPRDDQLETIRFFDKTMRE